MDLLNASSEITTPVCSIVLLCFKKQEEEGRALTILLWVQAIWDDPNTISATTIVWQSHASLETGGLEAGNGACLTYKKLLSGLFQGLGQLNLLVIKGAQIRGSEDGSKESVWIRLKHFLASTRTWEGQFRPG